MHQYTDVQLKPNPHWLIGWRKSTIKRLHRVTPDLIQHTLYCHRSTMCNVTLKYTPPIKKLAPLTTGSCSLRCISAAEHHTAEQYSKTGMTKPRKPLARDQEQSNIKYYCKDLIKIPCIWEAALETEWRCFWKVTLKSNISHFIKVIRLLQHSSIYSLWGWLGMHCAWLGGHHGLSLTLNLIPQNSHHSLTCRGHGSDTLQL